MVNGRKKHEANNIAVLIVYLSEESQAHVQVEVQFIITLITTPLLDLVMNQAIIHLILYNLFEYYRPGFQCPNLIFKIIMTN